MFFILSKSIYYLAMPFSFVGYCLLFAYLFRKKRRRRNLWLGCALCLAYLFSNKFLANELQRAWDWSYVQSNTLPKGTYGILLGGMVNQNIKTADNPIYSNNTDRIIQTAHLYRGGIINKILVTGGVATVRGKEHRVPEALLIQKTLVEWGIPTEDIWLETSSINTHENALFSKHITDSLGISSSPILITSAFHMRRSMGCFRKMDYDPIPYPTGHSYSDRDQIPIAEYWYPTEEAPVIYRRVFREILGMVAYKIQGYL